MLWCTPGGGPGGGVAGGSRGRSRGGPGGFGVIQGSSRVHRGFIEGSSYACLRVSRSILKRVGSVGARFRLEIIFFPSKTNFPRGSPVACGGFRGR